MTKFCFFILTFFLVSNSTIASGPELAVTPMGEFDVNKNLRLAIEMTTIYDEVFDATLFESKSLEVASLLQKKFPQARPLEHIAYRSWAFVDGIGKKPFKIEIDGDLHGRPLVEVTTPPLHTDRADVFDTVMDVFNSLPTHPHKDIGGGHLRVRIKKKLISPHQMANLLRLYYSYFDIVNFSFRHEKRSHATAAPTIEEKGHYDSLVAVLKRLGTANDATYAELAQSHMSDYNLDILGGMMKNKKILLTSDGLAYDKYYDFNLGRLYATYIDPGHESLMFEFRLFDAPLSAKEARTHLKFMMGLFNRAMNSEITFERKYQGYARSWRSNKSLYERNLKETLEEFGLDWNEFSYLVEQNTY